MHNTVYSKGKKISVITNKKQKKHIAIDNFITYATILN